eukprot:c13781_g1_i2.p1 GENE.c13781_g1_i2~~c13781_g1_i2.p1  ORF type:complete len:381 (+),score=80.04 c13781_g1_i2:46-1143(+)
MGGNGSRVLVETPEREDYSTWMSETFTSDYESPTLQSILFPMTHDAATAGLSRKTFDVAQFAHDKPTKTRKFLQFVSKTWIFHRIVIPLTVTQCPQRDRDGFLTQQLIDGVRAFDLRLFCHTSHRDVGFRHGAISWEGTLLNALRHMRDNFVSLPKCQKEFIILHMSHFGGPLRSDLDTWRELLKEIEELFAGKLCLREGPPVPQRRLCDQIHQPIMMIFSFHGHLKDALQAQFPWLHCTRDVYDDDWPICEELKVTRTLHGVRRYCKHSINRPLEAHKFRELQMHFQAAPKCIGCLFFHEVLTYGNLLSNIEKDTRKANLNREMLTELKDPQTALVANVVAFDFYEAHMTQVIQEVNKALLKPK